MARISEQIRIRIVLMLVSLLLPASLMAEEDLEYKMEFGAGAGIDFYLGDANSTPFANMGGMGGIIVRRIFNPRMCVKANLAFGHIHGSSEGMYLPTNAWTHNASGGVPTKVDFSRNVLDVGAQFEMNFWGFGTGVGYKETSRITPYALAGIGFTVGMGGGGETAGGLCLPIGVGVKYKLKPRLNVGAEWTMRFTTSDNLDATSENSRLLHPFAIESSGLKNKDCYSFLMFYVTYDMCPKLRKCNN